MLGGILLITVGSGSLNISESENHHFQLLKNHWFWLLQTLKEP